MPGLNFSSRQTRVERYEVDLLVAELLGHYRPHCDLMRVCRGRVAVSHFCFLFNKNYSTYIQIKKKNEEAMSSNEMTYKIYNYINIKITMYNKRERRSLWSENRFVQK
jgi:hypothetical protein